MPPLDDDTLKSITNLIISETNPVKVIMFGSRARGQANKDSDLDLMIIEEEPVGAVREWKFNQMGKLYELFLDFIMPIDLLIFTPEEFLHWQGTMNHVIGRASKEGKVLYERT